MPTWCVDWWGVAPEEPVSCPSWVASHRPNKSSAFATTRSKAALLFSIMAPRTTALMVCLRQLPELMARARRFGCRTLTHPFHDLCVRGCLFLSFHWCLPLRATDSTKGLVATTMRFAFGKALGQRELNSLCSSGPWC